MRKYLTLAILIIVFQAKAQKSIEVDPFTKILVGPHVELVLEQGDNEQVELENLHIDESKINVKVKGTTLLIYLEDARISTKHRKVKTNNQKYKEPVYKGTIVTAKVTYAYLNKLSLRGEEYHQALTNLEADKFKVKMYGEGELVISQINTDYFKAKLYGDNQIQLKEGQIRKQKYKSFGENKVDSRGIESQYAKSKNYGENKLKIAVSDKIKFTAMGESSIGYKGNAKVKKGIVLGENEIYRIY